MTTYILFLRVSYCLFACRIEKTMHVFSKIWRFAKVYTREICQQSHSRNLILKVGVRESLYPRKFLLAKLCTLKVVALWGACTLLCLILGVILQFSKCLKTISFHSDPLSYQNDQFLNNPTSLVEHLLHHSTYSLLLFSQMLIDFGQYRSIKIDVNRFKLLKTFKEASYGFSRKMTESSTF